MSPRLTCARKLWDRRGDEPSPLARLLENPQGLAQAVLASFRGRTGRREVVLAQIQFGGPGSGFNEAISVDRPARMRHNATLSG